MTALSPLGLVCDPCSGVPQGFSPAKNLFAPRLGFAYDLLGNGKMAVPSARRSSAEDGMLQTGTGPSPSNTAAGSGAGPVLAGAPAAASVAPA